MSRIQNPFTLKIIKKEERPGYWNTNIVKILKDGHEVAEYKRGYPSHTKETFYPFLKNGKWYALISADYTRTQIMDLETGKIIGGEEPSKNGFCPTEFYIPKRYKYSEDNLSFYVYETLNENEYYEESNIKNAIIGDEEYSPFGFVSGCHWGDDHSWKIQMLDLSEADKGLIKRIDYFDYAELPDGCSLKSCIEIEDESNNIIRFNLKILKNIFLKF